MRPEPEPAQHQLHLRTLSGSHKAASFSLSLSLSISVTLPLSHLTSELTSCVGCRRFCCRCRCRCRSLAHQFLHFNDIWTAMRPPASISPRTEASTHSTEHCIAHHDYDGHSHDQNPAMSAICAVHANAKYTFQLSETSMKILTEFYKR